MTPTDSLLAHVRTSRTVLLTGPEGPDGDSIGASLALQRALAVVTPEVRVDVAGVPGFRYAWMPGADRMIADDQVGDYDGVVVLDGDRGRLPGRVTTAFQNARWTGIIDHHRSTDVAGYTWSFFDGECESTCVMVREMLRDLGIPVDRDLAALLYTGVVFDTGGFRYSNTRASTHRLAAELLETGIDHAEITLRVLAERRKPGLVLAGRMISEARFWAGGKIAVAVFSKAIAAELGATELDVEGVVDMLQHTQGVSIAVVLTERAPDRVKLSLRSRGAVDVAAVARRLSAGGGGHAKAAGAAMAMGLDAALALIEPVLTEAVGG